MDRPTKVCATAATLAGKPFGRRQPLTGDRSSKTKPNGLASDMRLFALTFAAGFLFVSIFLA